MDTLAPLTARLYNYWLILEIIIDREDLAKQGDDRIGSVRPFVCLSVCVCSPG